ncbi:MAG: glycosyltransferase [Acidobacteria bacterium]|nr:glycosyltransferase [Acidobacteriota bacterium]
MRVLALGALDVPYIRDNWSDALRHVLKEDVTQVNVSSWLACAPPEAHMKAIYRLLATGTYDYLFLYHDYIFSDFPEEFFAHVRSAGVRTIAYHPDDEPEVWYRRNMPFDPRYDVVASHAKRGVARRVSEGRPTRAIYVPWGFNPRFFDRAAGPVEPVHDVIFIGKYKVHENDSTLFREDGQRRDEALQSVASLCERNGWRFSLFGHGWERHPTLARFAGGVLSHAEMIQAYHRSKIVLNPGWTADEGEPVPQTKLRHFEVPGCGAFQMTNENPELAELFEADREIVFYRDNAELCERIGDYLRNEEERRAIAQRGYARAHADHTLDRRVCSLFTQVTRLFAPERSAVSRRPAPRVRTLHAATLEELRHLREEIESGDVDLTATDAVHITGCVGSTVSSQYSGLRDWWRAEAAVFAGRTFYQADVVARNPLQPQRSEMSGGFLTEAVELIRVPAWHRHALLSAMPAVFDEDRARVLMNYIARPEAVLPLIDAFLSGTPDAVDSLAAVETGLVFNEIRVALPPAPDANEDGTPVPTWMGPMRRVLRQAAVLRQRVALYGARGEMAEAAFAEVRRHEDVELVGLVDRAMAGRRVAGVPVYSAFDLPDIAPDLLIIAAAYSGPAIYEQLKPLEPRMTIVPLHDLKAPAWSVLVPA